MIFFDNMGMHNLKTINQIGVMFSHKICSTHELVLEVFFQNYLWHMVSSFCFFPYIGYGIQALLKLKQMIAGLYYREVFQICQGLNLLTPLCHTYLLNTFSP